MIGKDRDSVDLSIARDIRDSRPGNDARHQEVTAVSCEPAFIRRVIVVCLISLGIGVGASGLITLAAAGDNGFWRLVPLWLSMLIPVGMIVANPTTSQIFHARYRDLIWGVSCAIALRLVQGWVSGANCVVFPTLADVAGTANGYLLVVILISLALAAPVVEELFFRGVMIPLSVAVLEHRVGGLVSRLLACLISTSAFVAIHAIFSPLTEIALAIYIIFGISVSALTVLTGRIWPAIIAHVVYNSSFLALAVGGTLLA